MNNLNYIFPEIFLSVSIMLLLIIGVFKKNSSNIIYNLSFVSLAFCLILLINHPINISKFLFNNSYKIDYFSTFMKILTMISGIFVLITSSLEKLI